MRPISFVIAVFTLLSVSIVSAQQTSSTTVPNLIRYSGTLKDAQDAAVSSTAAGVTFAIYKQQDGGAPVWMETQTVTPDASGNYSVLLGSTTATGLPADLFSQEEQRWLGVQAEGQAEQPRVLLVSVPYAFKAHEAETLGGKSISDFVLANNSASATSNSAAPAAASTVSNPSSSEPATPKNAPTDGPTTFSGSTTDQIVRVVQSGTGAGLTASATTNAVYGEATGNVGNVYGVQGVATGSGGVALFGNANSPTGGTYGMKGSSTSTSGTGIHGLASATSGSTVGVSALVNSAAGTAGVLNNAAGGNILIGQNNGVTKFTVNGSGDVNISGNFTGSGSGLNGINFSQLVGQLGETQLGGTYSGAVTLSNSGNSFSGSGGGLTGIEFQNLGGTLQSAQLSGTYSGAVTLSNTSNVFSGARFTVSGTGTANGGLTGISSAGLSQGVYGEDDAALSAGVEGVSASTDGTGVIGSATASSGITIGVAGAASSGSGIGVYGNNTAASGNAYGVEGASSSGIGVYGNATAASGSTSGVYGSSVSSSGTGVYGNATAASGSTYGVYGQSASGSGVGAFGAATAASGNAYGVDGTSASSSGVGVYGQVTATTGTDFGTVGSSMSPSGYGVAGANSSTTGTAVGVKGITSSTTGLGVQGLASSTTGLSLGVAGSTNSAGGIGVYGLAVAISQTGVDQNPRGIWGTTNVTGGVGLLGTNDDGIAVEGANNANNIATALFVNNESTDIMGPVLVTNGPGYGGVCLIDVSGDVSCSGTISGGDARVDGGTRRVALYAVEAPENWFEDAGSGQLSHGVVVIQLEPVFAQTVNTGVEYHVFLTPNGDCKGLYVTNKTADSFEVHELGGGTASIGFDYRIMARRKGYESIRLADNTERFAAIASQQHGLAGTRPLVAPTLPDANVPTAMPREFVPSEPQQRPIPQRPPARREAPAPQAHN